MFAELARRARTGQFTPNCDVFVEDGGQAIIVNVEIAGANPDDLRVGVEKRLLLILGRRVDRSEKRHEFLQKEIEYGEFCKKIHLPVTVAYERASATYQDGLLTIRLPVAPEMAQPAGRAEVRMIVKRILA
jgi:HSP20 family protein